MNIHERTTPNYTIVTHNKDGSQTDVGEWFSLPVARKIAAKAHTAREQVANSPVQAIEIVDFDGNQIQIVKYKN